MSNGPGLSGVRQRVARRGLALPAIRTRGGYFASKSPHDTAWGDLMLAIFCPIGSRFMNRTFGSGLHTVLFEPNSSDLSSRAAFVVQDAAQKHAPHVVILDVGVLSRGKSLFLKISFRLVDDAQAETRLIELDRSGVVRLLGVQRIQG